jgi:hypothetical protein
VRNAENPEEILLNFLQSTYKAAANLGAWDRTMLEESSYRLICEEKRKRVA